MAPRDHAVRHDHVLQREPFILAFVMVSAVTIDEAPVTVDTLKKT